MFLHIFLPIMIHYSWRAFLKLSKIWLFASRSKSRRESKQQIWIRFIECTWNMVAAMHCVRVLWRRSFFRVAIYIQPVETREMQFNNRKIKYSKSHLLLIVNSWSQESIKKAGISAAAGSAMIHAIKPFFIWKKCCCHHSCCRAFSQRHQKECIFYCTALKLCSFGGQRQATMKVRRQKAEQGFPKYAFNWILNKTALWCCKFTDPNLY